MRLLQRSTHPQDSGDSSRDQQLMTAADKAVRRPRAPARPGRPLPSAAGRKRRMRLFAGPSPAGGLRGQAGGDHGRRDGVRFRPRARSFAPDPPRRGADSPPPRRPGPGVARGPPFQASSAAPAEPFGPHRLPPWRHYDSGGPVITDGRALRWSLITNGRALRPLQATRLRVSRRDRGC